MAVTSHLVFDPASLTESANVGAHIRAGDDGTVIGHVSDALKVNFSNTSIAVTATDLDIRDLAFATDTVDVSGSAVSITGTVAVTQSTSPWVVGDGGGSLTVDGSVTVTATDLDIRALTNADVVTVEQGTSPWVIGDGGGSITVDGSVTVTATQLDIDDLNATDDAVASWLFDGTGNALSSTSGALNVFIDGSDPLTINDASLADTAGSNAAVSVGTTSISLAASILAARKYLFAFNNANKAMYLGFGTVTSANGFPMFPGQAYEFRAGPALDMKVISTAAAQDARIMQLS